MNYENQRQRLIENLRVKGINEKILAAIQIVPRELFVNPFYKDQAYIDHALPIDAGQTISQPFIVALMTQQLLEQHQVEKVLEIGTGSGYQAAILAQLVAKVYTIERIELLYQQAKLRFQQLFYDNIYCKFDDGQIGWPEQAPFDGIIVTAAVTEIPSLLLNQLAENGRLLIPLGDFGLQELIQITRKGEKFEKEVIGSVMFVPLLSGKKGLS